MKKYTVYWFNSESISKYENDTFRFFYADWMFGYNLNVICKYAKGTFSTDIEDQVYDLVKRLKNIDSIDFVFMREREN